jgi:hypothetical protein
MLTMRAARTRSESASAAQTSFAGASFRLLSGEAA